MAIFGGVIRDEQGCIKVIFHSYLGTATNNMAELMALEKCLEILIESNLHNAIIEADSELIINAVKKICNGKAPRKVSKHWWLLQVFQCVHTHLQTPRMVSFVHMRRKANMLVDCLANEGVLWKESCNRYAWNSTSSGKLREDCQTQTTKDMENFQNIMNEQERRLVEAGVSGSESLS